jgi:hypothetical protein
MARALHETFCAHTPELHLMRDGLREYLGNRKRRAVSMALLSTEEGRLPVLLQETAQLIRYGLSARVSDAWRARTLSPVQMGVLLHLSKRLLRHAGEALRT